MPKHTWQTSPRRSATHPRTSIKPSSKTLKGGKKPIAALASASLVSLRSIATITASNNHGDKVETDGDLNIEMDRAFTPEEDPFAATTPISIISSGSGSAGAKHRSFLPFPNTSACSVDMLNVPISAPPTLTTFDHCQTLPPIPRRDAPQQKINYPRIRLQKGLATPEESSPSSAYSSLPSCLDSRPRTISTPSIFRESRKLNVLAALTRRKQTNVYNDSSARNSTVSSEDGKRVVGHSDSRPHSPFPLLFSRSKIQQSNRSSADKSASPSTSFRNSPLVVQASVPHEEAEPTSSYLEHSHPTQGNTIFYSPSELSAQDADVFGDDCEVVGDSATFEVKRDIVSPTAYLLEADYSDVASSADDSYMQADKSSAIEHMSPILDSWSEANADAIQTSNTHRQQLSSAESETETDFDTNPSELENWPLPPYRRVVVDVEKGEG